MTSASHSTLRIGQVRLTHAFGPVRVTTIERRADERVVHGKTLDGTHTLVLSPRYCQRLPVQGNA